MQFVHSPFSIQFSDMGYLTYLLKVILASEIVNLVFLLIRSVYETLITVYLNNFCDEKIISYSEST